MTKTVTMLILLAIGMTLITTTGLQYATAQAPSPEPEPEKSEPEPEDTTVTGTVPDWFRGVAGFWADDEISTAEFLDGIEFLISEGIISVPSSSAAAVDEAEIEDIWAAIGTLQDVTTENADAIASVEATGATEGPKGDSCSVKSTDYGALISCEDGSTAKIEDGKDATSQTIDKDSIYTVHKQNIEVKSGSIPGVEILSCHKGDLALSGGFDVRPITQEADVLSAMPFDDDSKASWRFEVLNNYHSDIAFDAYVICYDLTGDLKLDLTIKPKLSLP